MRIRLSDTKVKGYGVKNTTHNFSIETNFTDSRTSLQNMIDQTNALSSDIGRRLGMQTAMPKIVSQDGKPKQSDLDAAWEKASKAQTSGSKYGLSGSGVGAISDLTVAIRKLGEINRAMEARDRGTKFENYQDIWGDKPINIRHFGRAPTSYEEHIKNEIGWFQTYIERSRAQFSGLQVQ